MTYRIKKIAVTGSTGYIGQRFIRAALMMGYQVVSLSRRPCAPPSIWIKYDLGSGEPVSLPSDINVIVHLAANTSFHGEVSNREEIHAAKTIVNAAKAGDIKLIFISSQTARKDAPTEYGRTKFQIERLVIDAGGVVIRPGLVYGGPSAGLYGELVGLVERLYLLPFFFPAPKVQPIHVDDLVIGIIKISETSFENIGPVIRLGSIDPISFNFFLRTIAKHRLQNIRIFIPFPSIVVILMSKVLARIGGSLGRVNSLFNLPEMNTKKDLDSLNMKLRPLVHGMHFSGSNKRRRLLLEGLAFHTYIVNSSIKKLAIRNYVRIIEKLRNAIVLELPLWPKTWPFWIALLDRKKIKKFPWIEEFKWRLKAATLLAEANTAGAVHFIDPKGGGFMRSLFGIFGALLCEILLVICKFLFAPLLQLIILRKFESNNKL